MYLTVNIAGRYSTVFAGKEPVGLFCLIQMLKCKFYYPNLCMFPLPTASNYYLDQFFSDIKAMMYALNSS